MVLPYLLSKKRTFRFVLDVYKRQLLPCEGELHRIALEDVLYIETCLLYTSGTQAVMNIIFGERYKNFPKESRAMLRGEYGKLPGTVNEEAVSYTHLR